MKRLLIIDDDAEIVSLLQAFFERQGIDVSTGASGEDMWSVLETTEIDLIILDVLLPGADGISLCRELRTQSDIPIIMLTALDGETDRVVGLEVGADDYLAKPFSPRELLARVRAIMRRIDGGLRATQSNTPAAFTFNGFRLDIRRRELRTPDNAVVHLSRTEFGLLNIFMHRPSEAIDRNTLSEELRGHELEAFDRSIDLHVSRLRSKIGPLLGDECFIKTVRGTGYMFTLDVEKAL
ncbi:MULTISPECIES: response regulator [Pacificibacter]|uniref:response regulator n=1 Tax=Pacificibacter TaxID=1042323 RepID=UPI0026E471C4|nr:response regulator transcription factor [Pacificibacter sp. 1_MG-2023]MDO6617013.1 response regulator transcription factor [Pacificibacter sp. 1_MG-2023]